MNDTSISNRIKRAREAKGLSHAQVGEFIGLTQDSVRDLESYDDEIIDCVTIAEIIRLCTTIEIRLSDLFPELAAVNEISPEELRDQITAHLRSEQITLAQYEDNVGWTVSNIMINPMQEIREWNIRCLIDQCDYLGKDWKPYLKYLEEAQHAPPAGRGEAPRP